jgi:carboxyl-terminal processing protease
LARTLPREDEYLIIWDVCQLSSAASAGIVRGDIITAIDGDPVEKEGDDFSRDDRYEVVFGSGGDQVTLTVWQGPDQEPVDITLALSGVGDCPYRYYGLVYEDPRIGYIRVPDFDGDADFDILKSIKDMETEQPLDGLIVDVRHNLGGNSDNSVAVFTEGIVGTVGKLRENEQRQIYRIRGPVEWNETTPVVVLTDGSSHSAADYFPAAMRELGRATIVGMNSAGNTEGITGWSLADGTLIRLAISTLALNDGTILEGVGVTPDVIAPLGTWGLKQEPYDAQIQVGIDILLEQIGQ